MSELDRNAEQVYHEFMDFSKKFAQLVMREGKLLTQRAIKMHEDFKKIQVQLEEYIRSQADPYNAATELINAEYDKTRDKLSELELEGRLDENTRLALKDQINKFSNFRDLDDCAARVAAMQTLQKSMEEFQRGEISKEQLMQDLSDIRLMVKAEYIRDGRVFYDPKNIRMDKLRQDFDCFKKKQIEQQIKMEKARRARATMKADFAKAKATFTRKVDIDDYERCR